MRRRRRRGRRAVEGVPATDRPIEAGDQTRRAGRPDRDDTAKPAENAKPAAAGRRGRATKPAGRRSGTTGGTKSAGQQSEPSARTIRETERGWRDLAGNGSSQLGVSGALRARDVARPGPAELAEAERNVQLVRRQWQPPAAD
jgi:hypothetical protein